jgi:hypothetical protein
MTRVTTVLTGLIFCCACSASTSTEETETENISASEQKLWSKAGTKYWTCPTAEHDNCVNGRVRVCFYDGTWTDPTIPSQISTWRSRVQTWLQTEISPFAQVDFTDFTTCNPIYPGEDWLRIVGVADLSDLGNSHTGWYSDESTLDNRLRFRNPQQGRNIVLHEAMHALGYSHEWNNLGTDGCHAADVNNTGGTFWTRYDWYSIMNSGPAYCQNLRQLSAWDRAGLAAQYGPRNNVFGAAFSAGDSTDPSWTGWVSVASNVNPSSAALPNLTINDILIGNFVDDPLEDYASDDFLAATGSGWWVSPKGYQPWQQVSSSTIAAGNLLVGDFNGDGTSDILRPLSTSWQVSWSANSSWTPINSFSTSVPKGELLVGNFDGLGGDDVLRIEGGGSTTCSPNPCKWFLSSGASSPFVEINSSTAALIDLKVGDFDGTGGDDVFYGDGSTWRYSANASNPWQTLTNSSKKGRDLMVGNFDGLGHDDVLATWDGKIRVSAEAASAWVIVASSQHTVQNLRVANFGLGRGTGSSAKVRHSVFKN